MILVEKEAFERLKKVFCTIVGLSEKSFVLIDGEITVCVEKELLIKTLMFLRDHPDFMFKQLIDLCGVDYPQRPNRFDVVYHLLSHKHNLRIRVKTSAGEYDPVPTSVYLFSAADWYEREAFDMYGILFNNHPDLRRILTDYGFMGHPLRKDFPLTGYEEVYYDESSGKVAYKPVDLPQEYRDFDFLSPWDGMNLVLPGDEKVKHGVGDGRP